MPPYSVCFYLVFSATFFYIAKLIVKRNTFYQRAIEDSSQLRYKSLDGLRGFLALGVFFHHAIRVQNYFQTGAWEFPDSGFDGFSLFSLEVYKYLGDAAVSFFFMITGFLFWSKAIATGRFNIKKLYVGRALRIYPLYLFSLILIICGVLIASSFSLQVSWFELAQQITRWTTCGAFDLPFIHGITPFPSINQINAAQINSGVHWTLVYELQFYLVLPLLVMFVKPARFLGLFAAILVLDQLLPSQQTATMINFLYGMGIAYLVKQYGLEKRFSNWEYSLIALLLLIAIPLLTPRPFLLNTIVFFVFLLIVSGNSLLGLLTASASKYLGIVSYSIYLLHGIVLFAIFSFADQLHSLQDINPLASWLLIGISGLVVICLSGMTYRFVEYPFLKAKQSNNPATSPVS